MTDKASQTEYETAISADLHAAPAKELGAKVLKQMLSVTTSSALTDIHAQISAAATSGDDEKLVKLFEELKKLKDAEKANLKSLAELKKSTSFERVLLAFQDEFKALAYDISLEVIKGTHVALKNAGGKTKGTRKTSEKDQSDKPTFHTVTHNGKSEKLFTRWGRAAANLTQDEQVFTFLGFKIVKNEAGKEILDPATIKLTDGSEIPANRPNIAKAITEKTAFDGYTIA
ncbi:hypothetical protein ASE33_06860 [Pseudomonas sp. Root9]|jgi:hypothetical protein|uniref:hypothetical protein n=1 Tax=Pseudomonas sp. Root9 TaxID=1736604 RepID=UPI0006F850B7|nr:hypothetical protein [Pseudomonas sp. Root9]KRC94323.1 hypothetical protein ASE33_06860 [Pseudomonas sp. Root9]